MASTTSQPCSMDLLEKSDRQFDDQQISLNVSRTRLYDQTAASEVQYDIQLRPCRDLL